MVVHEGYGRGVVIGVKGELLTVAFKNKGIKNVDVDCIELDC